MKALTSILCAAAMFMFSCTNGLKTLDVPEPLKASLLSSFPDAQNIEWEASGENFEAEFELNKVEHTVLLKGTGELIMHKHDLPETELPQAVKNTISQNFSGMRIDDTEKLMIDNTTYYQMELDKKGKVFAEDGQEQAQISYWD